MKIRAQIGMVLNLDKCIGCHTCSVTCKNVWTNREGMEYAWFNNVETKPGIGYPKEWENQDKWNGGWVRKGSGKIEPRQGGKWSILMKIFANPNLPQIDDYYEPFTFDYEHLHTAPEMKATPVARPRSLITGQRMEKIEWGPNWEEILGGEFAKRVEGRQLPRHGEGDLRRVREHLHDVPAAPVRALPQSDVRRVVPVGLDLQARGGRHRADRPGQVPRLADVRVRLPVQEDLLQLVDRQGREVHLLLSAHRGRAADRVLGDLRRPHPLSRRAALRRRPHRGGGVGRAIRRSSTTRSSTIFLDPNDPEVIAQARRDGVPEAWLEAAKESPVYKMAVDWKVALPLHPEYRTLPMVWYVPPLSPISAAANAGDIGTFGELPDVRSLRIPLQYLANLLTAGDEAPVAAALERMLAMRAYMRDRHVEKRENAAVLKQVGLSVDAGRGDVPLHGDRQLRGPLRHPDRSPRIRRERVRHARRLRLLVRQRLFRRRDRSRASSAARRRRRFRSSRSGRSSA